MGNDANCLCKVLCSEDSIFKMTDDAWNNACINIRVHDKLDLYAAGYKRASDILAAHVISTGMGLDACIYPILFLYRHYLELRLKELLHSGSKLLSKNYTMKSTHSLIRLWSDARPLVHEIFPDGDAAELDSLERLLSEFSRIDEKSEAFRYPVNKKGAMYLDDIKYINVRNLIEILAKVESLLDGISCAVSAYLENMVK